jgi:hypothetical protein
MFLAQITVRQGAVFFPCTIMASTCVARQTSVAFESEVAPKLLRSQTDGVGQCAENEPAVFEVKDSFLIGANVVRHCGVSVDTIWR